MELWLYVVGFYVWQCRVWLPPGGLAVVARPGGFQVLRGSGQRLLWPWPGSGGFALGGWPFEVAIAGRAGGSPQFEDGTAVVFTDTPHPWDGSGRCRERWERLETGGWAARGAALLHLGSAVLWLSSPFEASRLARVVSGGGLGPEGGENDARSRLTQSLDDRFDRAAAVRAYTRARRSTRFLRWSANVYFTVLFLVTPLVILGGTEAAWWGLLPLILILHVATAAVLAVTCFRWSPRLEKRWERVFIGALYPPILLRSAFDLVTEAVVAFSPIVVASVVMEHSSRLPELVNGALARWRFPSRRRWCEGSPPPADPSRTAVADSPHLQQRINLLEDLATELDLDLDPHLDDPTAVAYCPLCSGAFRLEVSYCNQCGIPIRPYTEREPHYPPIENRDARR